jgi:hypothetical protein
MEEEIARRHQWIILCPYLLHSVFKILFRGMISKLDQSQYFFFQAAKFAHHTGGPVREPLVQRRTARMCVLYQAYNSERAWKDIGDRSQAPFYRSRVDHCWKIKSRKIRTDVGKLSFVNKTVADWNRLPEEATGTSLVKRHVFRKRVRKVYQ